jgi:hypothetical protein
VVARIGGVELDVVRAAHDAQLDRCAAGKLKSKTAMVSFNKATHELQLWGKRHLKVSVIDFQLKAGRVKA